MFRFTAILCLILLEIEYRWVLTRRRHGGIWGDILLAEKERLIFFLLRKYRDENNNENTH